MWSNHHVHAILTLAVRMLNAKNKTGPSIASVRQITSVIRTALVDRNAFSALTVLVTRTAYRTFAWIRVGELAEAMPTAGWPITSQFVVAKNRILAILTDLAVPFQSKVRRVDLGSVIPNQTNFSSTSFSSQKFRRQLHLLSKSPANRLRAGPIASVDQSGTRPSALANQTTWEFHQIVDRSACPARSVLHRKLVSISSVRILVLELAAETLNAESLTTIQSASARPVGPAIQ